jgi:hypothetical protein
MTHYITPTLHSSWVWYNRMDSKTKEDFLKTLNKVRDEPTDAMQAGIDFENAVHAVCEGKQFQHEDTQYFQCVQEVAAIVRGGMWQETVMMDASFAGREFLLYGKTDVIKKDWIYDIKFSQNYEIGKYSDSVQHPIYMACTGIHKFAYLISDGESVWREDYFFQPDTLAKLKAELSDMVGFIMADKDFKEAYLNNWKSTQKKEAA